MKKIGILTINDNTNYGNRLQNYALQVYLEKQGYIVETIINDTKTEKLEDEVKKLKKKDNSILNKIKNKLKYYVHLNVFKKREENFRAFNQECMKNNKEHINENNIPSNLKDQYDYFVIGSDQVWNPTFKHMSLIDFAMFSPKEKNIAYAASFGISEIEDRFYKIFEKGLSNIQHISVREKSGADLVRDIIQKDVEVLIDPTMLLTREEWEKLIEKHPRRIKEKYMFTYFLGEITKERKNFLKKISKQYNMKIVDVSKYGKYHYVGPNEFVSLIKNSELVITDSFHACVFALLFHIKFYAMERKENMTSMNSRIATLTEKFNISNVFINEEKDITLDKLDNSNIDKILDLERKKAFQFFKKSIQ